MSAQTLTHLRGWLRAHPKVHRQLRGAVMSTCRWMPGARQALARLSDQRTAIPSHDYQRWLREHDTLTAARRDALLHAIGRMPHRPLVSVLMPVFNTPEAYLRQAIASVQAQLYPEWELCIADDASTAGPVATVLREVAAADPRIRVTRLARNGHISAASNAALAMAEGEFVALMDHDDLLAPHALAAVALALRDAPGLQVLFSDEDKIDDRGRRSDPYFKPGWNPELLLTQNMVSHLGVYRRDLLRRIGGFREGFEGSQDWDLALRATAGLSAAEVRHMPLVLYHWRQGTGEASFSESSLDRCARAGRRAVADHLGAQGEAGAKVLPQPDLPGWSMVAHPLPATPPTLSIILTRALPTRMTADEATLREGLLLPAGLQAEILTAGTAGPLAAASAARGEMLLFLDPDLRPDHPEWLLELLAQALRPGAGAAGPLVQDAAGHALETGRIIDATSGESAPTPYLLGLRQPAPGYFGHLRLSREVSAVGAACLILSAAVLRQLPEVQQPERDWAVELCQRLRRAGRPVIWTPRARLRWSSAVPLRTGAVPGLARDPYFNPNLAAAGPRLRLSDTFSGWSLLEDAAAR